jgi:hypothetical protein
MEMVSVRERFVEETNFVSARDVKPETQLVGRCAVRPWNEEACLPPSLSPCMKCASPVLSQVGQHASASCSSHK